MDVEELSKSQIILLTLFTSFVTSIATGIVTVTLLNEAPEPVVRTINRIVERTVETVVPTSSGGTETVQKTETTVVVKEEDLIANSIASVEQSLVRIYTIPEQNQTGDEEDKDIVRTFRGFGIVVSPNGLIATPDSMLILGRRYQVSTADGTYFDARIETEGKDNFGILRAMASSTDLVTFHPAPFADLAKIRLGQTAVALFGEEVTRIETGVITEILRGTGTENTAGETITSIKTSVDDKGMLGSPLISAFGEVMALGTNEGFQMLTKSKILSLITVATSTPN